MTSAHMKRVALVALLSLPITAIEVGPHTDAAPAHQNAHPRTALHPSMELRVAAKLRTYGYTINNPAQLAKAVKHWQKANGIWNRTCQCWDGEIGPVTLASLHLDAGSSPAPKPAVVSQDPPPQAPPPHRGAPSPTLTYSPGAAQWHDLAIQVGWQETDWPVLSCIIGRESNGLPWVKNKHSSATGLLQILASYYPGQDLTDPTTNLTIGLELHDSRGWQPWHAPSGIKQC